MQCLLLIDWLSLVINENVNYTILTHMLLVNIYASFISVQFSLLEFRITCVYGRIDRNEKSALYIFDPKLKTLHFNCFNICFVSINVEIFTHAKTGTVLPAKSDSDVMFCLQRYKKLRIDRSRAY